MNTQPMWARSFEEIPALPRTAVHNMVDVLIARLDEMDPDPDNEPNGDDEDGNGSEEDFMFHNHDGPGCPVADPDGPSVPEWHTLGRHKTPRLMQSLPHEDAEEDDADTGVEDGAFDPEEDMCLAGDDRVCSGSATRAMLICEDTGPGDADDAEREQLPDDVPCLAVYSIEPNVFTSKREYLGHSNVKPSFVSGSPMVAAD